MGEDKYIILDNIFSEKIIDLLYISCNKHFVYNVKGIDNITYTNCIIDCHGLTLSPNVVFPYYENHWNIFCMTIKEMVLNYCDDINLNKDFLSPHSCWAERSIDWKIAYPDKPCVRIYREGLDYYKDLWLENHLGTECRMIRVIYFLKNSDEKYGTTLKLTNDEILNIPGKENSVIIFQCDKVMSSNRFPTDTDGKYNIIFDWYIHDPKSSHKPAWFLPDLKSEYGIKYQIKEWWKK